MDGSIIENLEEYIYLRQNIKLAKANNAAEMTIDMGTNGINLKITIYFKRKVFNNCILPVMAFNIETVQMIVKSANKLRRTKRAVEHMILGISFKDYVTNKEIRDRCYNHNSKNKMVFGHIAKRGN